MRAISFDLSIAATGIALGLEQTLTIRTDDRRGDLRLCDIEEHVVYYLDDFRPDVATLEDLPKGAHGSETNGLVHGVVRKELARRSIPHARVVPSTLKAYATGDGRCDKDQMYVVAHDQLGFGPFADHNQCDAWWLAAMTYHHYGQFVPAVPAATTRRMYRHLQVVKWPEVRPVETGPRARA